MVVDGDNMLLVVEQLGIGICHPCEYLKQEEIKVLVGNRVNRRFTHGYEFLDLRFVQVRSVAFFSLFVLETVIGILFEKSETESFIYITLKTLVVVVDGCRTATDGLPLVVSVFSSFKKRSNS